MNTASQGAEGGRRAWPPASLHSPSINLSLNAWICASYFWFRATNLFSAAVSSVSRFWIRSFRARSLRSAMAVSFLSAVFCSTSYGPSARPSSEDMEAADLFLDIVQGIEVVFQELEFTLLGFRIGRPCNDLVLLLDFIQLHLELDDLLRDQLRGTGMAAAGRTFSHRFCRSFIRLFLMISNSEN